MKAFVCVSILFVKMVACENVIQNPGFEHPLTSTWHDWISTTSRRTDDVHSGNYSIQVSYRGKTEIGLTQTGIKVKPGGHYTFKAFFKQLDGRHGNSGYNLFQTYRASMTYTLTDSRDTVKSDVALRPFVQFGSGWLSLEGDFEVPTLNFSSCEITIGGPEPDIDFLIDDVSLVEVLNHEDLTWEAKANARIETLRKSTVHVQVSHPPSYNPEDIVIKLDHKRHLFGFGCRVNEDWIVDPDYKEYQEVFYKLFNWATLDGFEWKKNKGTMDNPDYNNTIHAVDVLLKHGVKLRGHAMFWGVPGKSPDWMEKLEGSAMKTAIQDRVTFLTNITRGKISHWDVNNELLHGQLYEEKTGDPNYSQIIYSLVHEADPSAKLFLNDFDVVSSGAGTKAYVDLAGTFTSTNVSLYGLGAESYIDHDPVLIKEHLDELSRTNLTVWISQLTVCDKNASIRGDWLTKAMRLYFSHPSVEGVTLWGFWDLDTDRNSSLINGLRFNINGAGKQLMKLVLDEWSTHVFYNLSAGPIHPVRGFHGEYDITVFYQGKPIKEESFVLGKTDKMYKIDISGEETEISLTTTISPFLHQTHNMHTTQQTAYFSGTMTSRVATSDLTCTSRWSDLSEFGIRAETHVQCEDNEVLTGCSSLHKDNDWLRGGESIEMRSAKIKCSAKTLASTLVGVYAIARCCKAPNMTCNYWRSYLHKDNRDEEVKTDCQSGYLATGCSQSQISGRIYEASPSVDHRSCVTFKSKNDEMALSGSCCKAPHLSCLKVTSTSSGLHKGDNSTVLCNDGYVMTSCNANSYSGKTAGAFIEQRSDGKDYCIATNGYQKYDGEEGAIPIAVCCKLDKDMVPVVG